MAGHPRPIPYLQVSSLLFGHPKIRELALLVGITPAEALGCVVHLWGYVATYFPDGNVSTGTPSDIIGLHGQYFLWHRDLDCKMEDFDRYFAQVGLIEWNDTADTLAGFRVHDWHDIYGKLLEKREKDRERKSGGKPPEKPRKSRGIPSTIEKEKELEKELLKPPPTPPGGRGLSARAVADFADAWNKHTEPPIPRIRDPQGKIRQLFAARARETHNGKSFSESWPEVCRRVQASGLCRGERGNGWIAKPRDILRPGRWQEIIDGAFLDAQEAARFVFSDPRDQAVRLRQAALEARQRGYSEFADQYDKQADELEDGTKQAPGRSK